MKTTKTKWMSLNKEERLVEIEDISSYKSNGWNLGRNRGRLCYNNGYENVRIPFSDVNQYEKDGWKRGRLMADCKQSILRSKYNTLKGSAKRRNILFDITFKEFQSIYIPYSCPYLNIPLKATNGNVFNDCISYDRIDNNKGYVLENMQVISAKANAVKSNLSIEELILFSSNALKMHFIEK